MATSVETVPGGVVSIPRQKKEFGRLYKRCIVESLNNGQVGDECFVHCSEVVLSSEVEMYGQYIGRG